MSSTKDPLLVRWEMNRPPDSLPLPFLSFFLTSPFPSFFLSFDFPETSLNSRKLTAISADIMVPLLEPSLFWSDEIERVGGVDDSGEEQ